MENIISRTMYCPKCSSRSHPVKGDIFVLFGTTRQHLIIRRSHVDGRAGYTPHIISWDEPVVFNNNEVKICVCCGVCGVDVNKDLVTFTRASYLYLPSHDFLALKNKWKRTGYELI